MSKISVSYVSQIRLVTLSLAIGIMIATAVLMVIFDRGGDALRAMKVSREAIVAAERMKAAVTDAEAASHEAALVRTPAYEQRAADEIRLARRLVDRLGTMAGGPGVDSTHLSNAVRLATTNLNDLQRLNRLRSRAAAEELGAFRRGFEAREMRMAVGALTTAEGAMLQAARRQVEQFFAIGRWLMLGLVVIASTIIVAAIGWVTHRMKRSIASLTAAMEDVRQNGVPREIEGAADGELGQMRDSFNAMIARLRQEITARDDAEARISELLSENGSALADRTRSMAVLSRISNRLPACMDQKELIELAARFVPQLMPIASGALYFLNNSQSVLRMVTHWGTEKSLPEFAPADCWALRRGQIHDVTDVATDVTCRHVHGDALDGFVCMPLVAQGEVVGLFFFERCDALAANTRQMEDLSVLCENLALALVNLRLRESLRHQSLRDPLTGLYNRRYLEEAIELEFAKAERADTPISVIMADVDHFKRLNDTYGHDTGDMVLRQVALSFGQVIRKGDVACRYGGEEFLILLPGLPADEAAARAEALRAAIGALNLRVGKQEVGKVTASFGVATMTGRDGGVREIVKCADTALYDAKTAGRDRVVAYAPKALMHAA